MKYFAQGITIRVDGEMMRKIENAVILSQDSEYPIENTSHFFRIAAIQKLKRDGLWREQNFKSTDKKIGGNGR